MLLGLALPAAHAGDDASQAAIRSLLLKTFDKPEARLRVKAIVTEGAHGVAAWFQGEMAGRALLRRQASGAWQIVACGGDGMKDPAALADTGMSAAQARALARRITEAEQRFSASERAQLSSFKGTVRMDGQGQHPQQGGAHH